jgi:hypothetical protein
MAYTPKASKAELEELYFEQKQSPEKIAQIYKCHPRSVRAWMYQYDIKLLGATHLITGKPAPWNKRPKPPHVLEALRTACVGRTPHNKGKGNISFSCEVCGTYVTDKPYRRKRTCSKTCKDELSHLQRGTTHWNYTGAEPSTQRRRLWADAREWRTKILTRDGYKCAACESNKRLGAHHIDGWAANAALRFDTNNGATLCHDCHWNFHRQYSHKKANRAMYEDWLKTMK